MISKTLAVGAALFAFATSAHAVTLTYDVFDHPDRAIGDAEYGIRLDSVGLFFSFGDQLGGQDATATLSIDTESATATLEGTLIVNNLANDNLGIATLSYSWDAITFTEESLSAGLFTSTVGEGTLSFGDTVLGLEGRANGSGNTFFFEEGHRLTDAEIDAGFGPQTGNGWLYVFSENGDNITYRTNDFLFTAVLNEDGGGDSPDGEIPLPAAGWMLLAGVGALRLMKKKSRA